MSRNLIERISVPGYLLILVVSVFRYDRDPFFMRRLEIFIKTGIFNF